MAVRSDTKWVVYSTPINHNMPVSRAFRLVEHAHAAGTVGQTFLRFTFECEALRDGETFHYHVVDGSWDGFQTTDRSLEDIKWPSKIIPEYGIVPSMEQFSPTLSIQGDSNRVLAVAITLERSDPHPPVETFNIAFAVGKCATYSVSLPLPLPLEPPIMHD